MGDVGLGLLRDRDRLGHALSEWAQPSTNDDESNINAYVKSMRALGASELARMLADDRMERFARSFTRQWLQLDRVGMFAPNRSLYPDYDKHLERSMVRETTSFFGEVLARNLSLREFLASASDPRPQQLPP